MTGVLRRELALWLRQNPCSVVEIAAAFDVHPNDVRDALRHIEKSQKHADFELVVTPARCRKCNFTFSKDKLRKPGKCPVCHGTWISEPLFATQPRH